MFNNQTTSSLLTLVRFSLIVFLLSIGMGCGGGGDNPNDNILVNSTAVGRWSTIISDASGRDHGTQAPEQGGPTRTSRALAIAHLAMHDAIQIIQKDYALFAGNAAAAPSVTERASLRAAVAFAAHDTLVSLFPSQTTVFDRELFQDVSAIADQDALTEGKLVGQYAATANLESRLNDGSDAITQAAPYVVSDEPGKWRPDPINPSQQALGSNWSKVRPFVLSSASQFRSPPPPAINSTAYAESYSEVFRLGGDGVTTPTERTQEQTEIGIFWAYDGTSSLGTPPRLYNQIALQVAEVQGVRSEGELARLLAYVNLAMADTGIAAWETKYFYNYWRPVAGVRESDPGQGPTGLGDGNDLTPGDVNFMPLGAPASNSIRNNFTPPFPAYVSGHAAFGGAVFETLRQYFGRDDISFTFVSDELNGQTWDNTGNPRRVAPRSFNSLSEAEEENGQSRIYLGIHWSFDKTEGIIMGNNVARFIMTQVLLPR